MHKQEQILQCMPNSALYGNEWSYAAVAVKRVYPRDSLVCIPVIMDLTLLLPYPAFMKVLSILQRGSSRSQI